SDDPLERVRTLYQFSPVINGVIAGLSVLALALFVSYLLTINRRSAAPADLMDELTRLITRGRFDQAADLCGRHRRVLAAGVIGRCLDNADQDPAALLDLIETEGRRRADVVWNRISYLADISNVAPMLGLLGTVIGMIEAFFSLESTGGSLAASSLSSGVGQAMATTMFGLMVGIGALVLYSVIKGRTTRTLADAEAAMHAVADHLKRAIVDAQPEYGSSYGAGGSGLSAGLGYGGAPSRPTVSASGITAPDDTSPLPDPADIDPAAATMPDDDPPPAPPPTRPRPNAPQVPPSAARTVQSTRRRPEQPDY
ncbi:MAG: MotA/TolQ/ExbB proton channel family protein, partial [Planctomycetota bacterium]